MDKKIFTTPQDETSRLPCVFRPFEVHESSQEAEVLASNSQIAAIRNYLYSLADQTRKNRDQERERATEEMMKGCWGGEPPPMEHKPEDYHGDHFVNLFPEEE